MKEIRISIKYFFIRFYLRYFTKTQLIKLRFSGRPYKPGYHIQNRMSDEFIYLGNNTYKRKI
jgi:hypothetical protein